MIYLKKFDSHASYETEINGGVDISLPNVSYCKDVKDVHYTPYNLVRFYVGDITGTTPQTVSILTNSDSIPIQVSEGNKWYTYVLPKDKGLYKIFGDSVKKVVVKADIIYNSASGTIIPKSTTEVYFKGSNTSNVTIMVGMFLGCTSLTSLDVSSFNTSNVTDMRGMFGSCNSLKSLVLRNFNTSNVTDMRSMFYNCSGLISLDLSGWDTSRVDNTTDMFKGCTSLTTIRMKGCSEATIKKITDVKPSTASIVTE